MERETLSTHPRQMPLAIRENIIMTRDETFSAGDALIVYSVDELLAIANTLVDNDIFVIGGAERYRTYYNFIKLRKYYNQTKRDVTPAMRIGIENKKYELKDIVYFV